MTERGTLRLDRRYPGVGRIRRKSGTNDPGVREEIYAMLTALVDRARIDIVQAIRDGHIHPLEVLSAYRERGIRGLPNVEGTKRLDRTVEAWLATLEVAPRTLHDYRYDLARLQRLGASGTRLDELPRLLARYRDMVPPRTFNGTRAAARSLVSDLFGRYSDLYRELSAVQAKKERKAQGRPQSPTEAKAVATALGRYGGMWWTLCCTGMSGGPTGPYFTNRLTVRDDCIEIHGTKTVHRRRVVPRLSTPIRRLVRYQTFAEATAGLGLTPNDGRRTYEHWLELAIPEASIRHRLMGHSARGVTERYGHAFRLEPHLADCRRRLLELIGEDWRPLEMIQ